MSQLGSLYIEMGEPDGELCGGNCEVDDWAAQTIKDMSVDLLKARTLLMRWCNDTMTKEQVRELEKETIKFCSETP
jgi:hypothetical protein